MDGAGSFPKWWHNASPRGDRRPPSQLRCSHGDVGHGSSTHPGEIVGNEAERIARNSLEQFFSIV